MRSPLSVGKKLLAMVCAKRQTHPISRRQATPFFLNQLHHNFD